MLNKSTSFARIPCFMFLGCRIIHASWRNDCDSDPSWGQLREFAFPLTCFCSWRYDSWNWCCVLVFDNGFSGECLGCESSVFFWHVCWKEFVYCLMAGFELRMSSSQFTHYNFNNFNIYWSFYVKLLLVWDTIVNKNVINFLTAEVNSYNFSKSFFSSLPS